jgi:ABC-2 type transport system ATP-binding protein
VGAVAAAGGHVLTDLRPVQRGIEDLFFQLTAA